MPVRTNAFRATLSGATAVRLDLDRMDIDIAEPITGTITTDRSFALRLDGGWTTEPLVTGASGPVTLADGVLTIPIGGSATITIAPVSTAGAL
jgi:hypothetical protein